MKLKLRDLTCLGMMLALVEVSKRALEFLPNVELVTLLFLVFALYFGPKTILAALAFTFVECFVWGVSTWTVMYLYIWPLEIVIALWLQHKLGKDNQGQHWIVYSIFTGIFGLFFGALCSIPYWFIGGPVMAVTWWVAGIPFDIVHCIGNFVLCAVLFRPLCAACRKVSQYMTQL